MALSELHMALSELHMALYSSIWPYIQLLVVNMALLTASMAAS